MLPSTKRVLGNIAANWQLLFPGRATEEPPTKRIRSEVAALALGTDGDPDVSDASSDTSDSSSSSDGSEPPEVTAGQRARYPLVELPPGSARGDATEAEACMNALGL